MATIQKRLKVREEKLKLHNERKIRIKALAEAGYFVSDIAKTVEVSEAFVRRTLEEKKDAEG